MFKKLTIIGTCTVLAACAQKADNIDAAQLPADLYASTSCSEAGEARVDLAARLADLSEAQDKAASADAASVFLFGVPGASLAGKDKAHEIAALKGQVAALDARLERC